MILLWQTPHPSRSASGCLTPRRMGVALEQFHLETGHRYFNPKERSQPRHQTQKPDTKKTNYVNIHCCDPCVSFLILPRTIYYLVLQHQPWQLQLTSETGQNINKWKSKFPVHNQIKLNILNLLNKLHWPKLLTWSVCPAPTHTRSGFFSFSSNVKFL